MCAVYFPVGTWENISELIFPICYGYHKRYYSGFDFAKSIDS